MKWVRLGVLVVMVCLPVFVMFTFDDMYNGLQDQTCQQYPSFAKACAPYEKRYARVGLISTAFYRHISYYLGRNSSTTPAFIESVRGQTDKDNLPDPRIPRVEKKLTNFNRSFIAALNISLAIAGAALTITIQKIVRRAHRRTKNKSAKKRTAIKLAPTIIKPSPAKRTATPASAATPARKITVKIKPSASKRPAKKQTKPKAKAKPRAIRPGTRMQ